MRTIAITNQKGGSGKTTTAVNLAAALGEMGKRALVVDMDPQASATRWLGIHDAERGLWDVFTGKESITSLVIQTKFPGVDAIPSSSWLLGIDKAMASEVGAETILQRALRELPSRRWDFLVIDCPPSLGLLCVSALVAAREVLVPVEASIMAMAGLVDLVHTIDRVKERLNADLSLSAILACRVDVRRKLSKVVIESLRSRFGGAVLQSVIRENVRLMEAPSFEQPITLYAPRSAGAKDYRRVAAELLKRKRRD